MLKFIINSGWKMRRAGGCDQNSIGIADGGQNDGWNDAEVPGTVYSDLLRNGLLEDPFFKDNEDKALKLMDYDYEYSCSFVRDDAWMSEQSVRLLFEGLDTIADITLNGIHIGHTENMHRTYEFDIKNILRQENELRVYFHSPNKWAENAFEKDPIRGSEDAMSGFVHMRKAHCMFGWDWGAHLPDAGIFRPVSIIAYSNARLLGAQILQDHDYGDGDYHNDTVKLTVIPDVSYIPDSDKKLFIQVSLTAPDGEICTKEISSDELEQKRLAKRMAAIDACEQMILPEEFDDKSATDDDCEPEEFMSEKGNTAPKCSVSFEIPHPELWWPNGYGDHPLYQVEVFLRTLDERETIDSYSAMTGLRTCTMSTKKDEWGSEFACMINGVKIFAMGADYIPEDHLISRVTPETTRKLLEKVVFANMNAIRVWGGGYYPDDWFYNDCDELGILVWQDFMFACADYDLTPEFEANIKAEFRDNLVRIRNHASLAVLCGNNEMETFMLSGEWRDRPQDVRDYLIMFEKILPEMCKRYAPQIFYWPASPSSGGSFDEPNSPDRGDVHYWDVWHGSKPFTEYRKFFFRFASEFGFQSFPLRKTIDTITDDPKDLNVFSYIMEKHQRNGAANGKIMDYMQQTYLYPTDFDTLLYASQLLQADAIRYGVEHWRRNRGRCMGAIVWQLNDCWPVASWSSIDYCGRLKALHYSEKRFFAPIMISCKEEGFMSSGNQLNRLPYGFEKSIHLNVTNESMKDIDVVVRWEVRNAKARILEKHESSIHVKALTSYWLDKILLPDINEREEYVSYSAMVAGLEQNGQNLCVKESGVDDAEMKVCSSGTVIFSRPKYFRYEDPQLSAAVSGDIITVSAKSYAAGVEILNENEDLILSDNYFDMNGGVRTVRILSGKADKLRLRSVYDIK